MLAFVNTNTAAAAATVAWSLIEYLHKGKATVLGACTGAVAGLVAITPAAGYVTPLASIAIGGGVCVVCYGAILMKTRLGYDDSLDVFGVHGVGGMFGAIAVGVFATSQMMSVSGVTDRTGGLVDGSVQLLGMQGLSVLAAAGYSFVGDVPPAEGRRPDHRPPRDDRPGRDRPGPQPARRARLSTRRGGIRPGGRLEGASSAR